MPAAQVAVASEWWWPPIEPRNSHAGQSALLRRRRRACGATCAFETISVIASTMPKPPRSTGTMPTLSVNRSPVSLPTQVWTLQGPSWRSAVAS